MKWKKYKIMRIKTVKKKRIGRRTAFGPSLTGPGPCALACMASLVKFKIIVHVRDDTHLAELQKIDRLASAII